MRFSRAGSDRSAHGVSTDERIDVAAVIAQALNRAGAPDRTALPAPAPEPAARQPAARQPAVSSSGAGATIAVSFRTLAGDDPLVAALLPLGHSVVYDLDTLLGGGQWDELVIELPPAEEAAMHLRIGDAWQDWRPSLHSAGTLEVLRSRLASIDPGTGYDVAVRSQQLLVCRWPHRSWHGHPPELPDADRPTRR